jgi:hypothetical protein
MRTAECGSTSRKGAAHLWTFELMRRSGGLHRLGRLQKPRVFDTPELKDAKRLLNALA